MRHATLNRPELFALLAMLLTAGCSKPAPEPTTLPAGPKTYAVGVSLANLEAPGGCS